MDSDMSDPVPSPWQSLVERLFPRLKYPHLFTLLLALFLVDLLIPDAIPFVDELLLGVLTVLVGSWRTRRQPARPEGDAPRLPDRGQEP
jgi:hypothetical protein